MEIENQRDYFSLLIPGYLRGDLDLEEVKKLESAAEQDAEIAADIKLQRNLRAAMSDEKPAEDGWDRLQAAMRTDATEAKANAPALSLVPSQNEIPTPAPIKAANSNEPSGVNPFWRIAAVALAVVGLGHITLSGMQAEPGSDVYLTVSEAGYVPNATLKVGFSESALLSDMTDILTETGGQIINGPSTLGLYSVTYETPDSCITAQLKLSRGTTNPTVETISECE
ncbi:hypothetical protein [Litorimonas sp. WD9-15]|uniref:hypothetical protein n=1 Tax=Litorimonas sp. WD9-15 TaxID=3418716 RepID=UPI003CFDF1B8